MATLAIVGGAAIPFTATASGGIMAIGVAGSVATGLQCAVGALRLVALDRGYGAELTWLDSQGWYMATMTALDVISLAAAGTELTRTVKIYKMMKASSSRSAIEWLQGLSRPERKRLTEEIIRARNPGISNSGIKAAMKAGVYPKHFPGEDIQRRLQQELAAAITNAMTFVGSGITGTIRNPQNLTQSGRYVVGTLQSFALM